MKTLRGGPLDGVRINGLSEELLIPVVGGETGDTVRFLTGRYSRAGDWKYEGAA